MISVSSSPTPLPLSSYQHAAVALWNVGVAPVRAARAGPEVQAPAVVAGSKLPKACAAKPERRLATSKTLTQVRLVGVVAFSAHYLYCGVRCRRERQVPIRDLEFVVQFWWPRRIQVRHSVWPTAVGAIRGVGISKDTEVRLWEHGNPSTVIVVLPAAAAFFVRKESLCGQSLHFSMQTP